MSALGLYVHVPFCARRCDYCDFYVVVGREADQAPFVEAVVREIRGAAASIPEPGREADTIYLGGGTPSSLPPPAVRRLVAACRDAFRVLPGAEVTLEANPEGIDEARLAAWLEAGVNRISVGVQALDDATLRRRGRLHTGAEALASLRRARRAGFRRVGADLIAGLPPAVGPAAPRAAAGEEPAYAATFAGWVGRVIEEGPEHLSVYLFETDKETPLMREVRRGREVLPPDDDAADAYERTCRIAASAGYEHYEIANFCLPGGRSRHNMKYWTGGAYLGFGPGAHSHFGGRRFAAPRDLTGYLAAAAGGAAPPASDYTLAGDERAAREALVLNLRLTEGVDLERFDAAWGTGARAWALRDLAEAFEAGLVETDGARLRLTPPGYLLANEVFARLAP